MNDVSMTDFDPATYPTKLAALIPACDEADLGPGEPNQDAADALAALDRSSAFAPRQVVDRDMADACHAGLWLAHNFLDESHTISQGIDNPTGSFWHGIMHRREGDFSNAKYWFRHAGEHPVFEPLAAAAAALAEQEGGDFADQFSATWDPFAFVDLRQAARSGGLAKLLRHIARREWELLFEYSFRAAVDS